MGVYTVLSMMVLISHMSVNGQVSIDCTLPADLYFVIDGSNSLTDEQFRDSKKFVVDVLKAFDVRDGKVHIGANVFGTEVEGKLDLYGPTNSKFYEALIMTLYREKFSATATHKALNKMRSEFRERGRAGVTKVGVVITDGKSINGYWTATESLAARNEGIKMIAIGIGEDRSIFRPELADIAGDPSNVHETSDLSTVVRVIQDAIKAFTCNVITTTVAPTKITAAPDTTPEPSGLGNDFDCPDCLIGENRGFLPHPTVCFKYLEVVPTADGNRTILVRKCPSGLFWDQYNTACDRPDKIDCDNDPCKNAAVASYDRDGSCSGYIKCIGQKSFMACCNFNERYVAGSGCIADPTCADNCQGEDSNKLQGQECDKFTFAPSGRLYLVTVNGPNNTKVNITMPCARGTRFNQASCQCSDMDLAPDSGYPADCNPAANFTFDAGFSDTSGNQLYAGTEFVTVANGNAKFNGNGFMNIYRFSGDTFAKSLVIRVQFQPSGQGSKTQALVTNCVYSQETRSSVSIKVVHSTQNTIVVVFGLDTENGTTELSVPLTQVVSSHDVIMIYDGANLTGVVDGVKRQASITGNVLRRRSGIIIGAGSQLGFYSGSVDEFQLYKCLPGFAEAYRT